MEKSKNKILQIAENNTAGSVEVLNKTLLALDGLMKEKEAHNRQELLQNEIQLSKLI